MRRVKLKDIAEINPGKSEIDKDAVDQVSFVAMADVSEEGFISNHENRSLSEVYKGYTYFKRNDVLLAKITPCFENGKAAIADNIPNEIGFGSSEFHVLRTNGEVLPKYLFYALWNEPFRIHGSKKMTGSAGQKRVPTNFLKNYEIPLPSLSEQKAIVARLDCAQRLTAIDREMLAKYDELIQSVFLEMFGDPVGNEKDVPKRKIKEIGEVVTGNTPPKKNPENYGDVIEWVKTTNIVEEKLYPTKAEEYLSEIGKEQGRIIPVNSLIVCCIAGSLSSIGKCSIVDREIAINQQINAIVPNSEIIDTTFLYAQLLVGKKLIQDASTKSMKGMVSKSKFQKIELLVPDMKDQIEFSTLFKRIGEEKHNLSNDLKKSEELFSSLVQGVFE